MYTSGAWGRPLGSLHACGFEDCASGYPAQHGSNCCAWLCSIVVLASNRFGLLTPVDALVKSDANLCSFVFPGLLPSSPQEQVAFDKCYFPFMTSALAAQWQGGFCQRTCQRCSCAPDSGIQCAEVGGMVGCQFVA